MDALIDLAKTLIAREKTRLAGWAGAALLAGALAGAKALGIELSPEIITGIQALGVLIVLEVIRRFVTPVSAPVLPAGTTVQIENTERSIVVGG